MARENGRELPPALRGLANISSEVSPRIPVEVPVLVVADNTDLRSFTERIYGQMASIVEGHGGSVPFTVEELLSYHITALKVRVEHTTSPRERMTMTRTSMRPEEPWALLPTWAYVLNGVGQVVYGTAGTLIYPSWEPAGDAFVMTPSEALAMTGKIRSLQQFGVKSIRAMEKNREGVIKVMVLTWMNDNLEGEWVSPEPFGIVDALTASLAGLRPSSDYTRPDNPLWILPYRVDGTRVTRYIHEASMLDVDVS